MLTTLGSQTVYVLEAVIVDDDGTDVADWSQPPASRVRVDGASVQPLQSREVLANRDAQQAAWRVVMSADVEVTGRSRIEFQGVPHNVVGEPLRWSSPSGTVDHIELLCDAWRG